MALNELSITVCRSDDSQAWGSESTLMKFMAEKGVECRRKGKSTETMEPAQLSASVKP